MPGPSLERKGTPPTAGSSDTPFSPSPTGPCPGPSQLISRILGQLQGYWAPRLRLGANSKTLLWDSDGRSRRGLGPSWGPLRSEPSSTGTCPTFNLVFGTMAPSPTPLWTLDFDTKPTRAYSHQSAEHLGPLPSPNCPLLPQSGDAEAFQYPPKANIIRKINQQRSPQSLIYFQYHRE